MLAKHCRLRFDPQDIKHLIVANDAEALELVAQVEGIKAKGAMKRNIGTCSWFVAVLERRGAMGLI